VARGTLRIYLGAAPGVGKTFAMLNEGRRRAERGTDVVVGFVETHGRPNTAAQVEGLVVVPRRTLEYRGGTFEEMDLDAVLLRHPAVALVDELAHSNVPGSRHEKRWQDVEELLAAGIDVISTVNIQHLESLNDVVEEITGIEQRETIPDAVVRSADQVELVDMSPEALRRRMAHGNVYRPEKVDAALANYFRIGNLGALREVALMWVADRVDEALDSYRESHGISSAWETRERVVVAITGAPGGEDVVRRAARMAMRTRGELLGVYVRSSDGLATARPERLAELRRLIGELGGSYREVAGDDIAETLVRFAAHANATQLVVGASRHSRLRAVVRGSVIADVLRSAGPLDVHVISTDPQPAAGSALVRRRRVPLTRRRRTIGWVGAVAGPFALTAVLSSLRSSLGLPGDLLLYLLLVVIVAAVGGLWPAVVAAAAAALLVNYFFTPPIHTFTISEGENLLALVVFLAVAVVVSLLVETANRRAVDAAHARADAETLAAMTGTLAGADDPLTQLVAQLRGAFDATAVAVLHATADGWVVEAASGEPIPTTPSAAAVQIPLDADDVVVLDGANVDDQDLDIAHSFAAQVKVALERRRLQADAAELETVSAANAMRMALLAAVSHDLRTPLASIKASVTSLLQSDVAWTAAEVAEFLETIDEGTDRLDSLVGNLLDMSRLQTGALQLLMTAVGLDEIVPRALTGLPDRGTVVEIDVPEHLPRVRADAALLERAVANIVDNACAWSPEAVPVRVEATPVGSSVVVSIVDRGPGVPLSQREAMFEPFQRLGDRRADGVGVGLGLAVAKGFVEGMGGRLDVEDTPGGGLTMRITLAAAV